MGEGEKKKLFISNYRLISLFYLGTNHFLFIFVVLPNLIIRNKAVNYTKYLFFK